MTVQVFSAEDVRARLPMAVCIELMEQVQAALSRGEINLPLRSATQLPFGEADQASLLIMPGALTSPPVSGAKLLSLYPENGQMNPPLPTIQGYVLLFAGSDGRPLALVEAASLTAIRTAAASAAATRALARPEASSLALLGCGVQAASHLEAMRAVRPVSNVTVWGRDPARARAFAARQDSGELTISVAESPEEAVRGADLVCAVSGSPTPVILGEWLSPGVHLNLVGAHTAATREADGRTLARARVFTEVLAFAMAEAGDILLAVQEGALATEDIAGEIGQVFNGDLAGRRSDEEITLNKSLGNTAQDLIAAHQVLTGGGPDG